MSDINIDTNTENEELRYGISAIDLKHKKYAMNDELMVHGSDGKMFYKRESDGQIVTSDNLEYTKDQLISAINNAMLTNEKVSTVSTDCLIYNTIDIAEKNDLLIDIKQELDIPHQFITKKVDSGFFVRVRGDNATNAIVSQLVSKYNSENPTNTTNAVSIGITISEIGTTYSETISVDMNFDTLRFIKLSPSNQQSTKGYTIKIDSITYPILKDSYNSISNKSSIFNINYGNTKFEANAIDLVYYSSDSIDTSSYEANDKTTLQYVLPVNEIDSDVFVISNEKPTHKCLWAKVVD